MTNGQMALIDRPVSIDGEIFDMRNVPAKDGYQKAYQRLAMLFIEPLASVLRAADCQYFQKLHTFADCRFGLVGFSSSGPLNATAIHAWPASEQVVTTILARHGHEATTSIPVPMATLLFVRRRLTWAWRRLVE